MTTKTFRIKFLTLTFLLIGLFFSSCQTIHYKAIYDIKTNNKTFDKETVEKIITELAEKHKLSQVIEDTDTDTLEFHGRPYHLFRFVIRQIDEEYGKIQLEYWGTPTKKNSYRKLLNNLPDSIQTKYIIIDKDINETK